MNVNHTTYEKHKIEFFANLYKMLAEDLPGFCIKIAYLNLT